jgi:OFA family oxalate/formate antiporter-like MFS transporter
MSENKTFNRWLLVLGAILIQLSLGAIYAWSVFRKPLEAELGITPTQASLPFSVVLIAFALATVIGGRMQDKLGPKIVAIIGGVLLAAGMILASLARDITMLIISYGVISGIGIGFTYVCPISAGVKWFPDKRGLITGLSVAGFGAGALIVGPLARAMIDSPAIGVFATFRWLGVAYLVMIVIGGLILRNPPEGYKPAGWEPPAAAAGKPARSDYNLGQMLSTGQFWLIWLLYFAGCAAGLMIIGQTSPIGQRLAGFTPATAAIGVSVLSIFNGLGRIFWGKISDNLGRTRTLAIMYLINGVAVFGYFLIPSASFIYWVGIALVGATFGGYLALYPAMTADFYGTKHVGLNYGFVFTAYGVGGLLSNIFAPRVLELTGNYNFAFIMTGTLCIIAALVILFVKSPTPKTQPA